MVTKYVDECHSGKYVRYLLRDSYRQDGKVQHRTIADLSSYSSSKIQAIQIVQELARRWQDLDATVPEGIEELKTLCTMELRIQGHPKCNCIPQPRASVERFLEKAKVALPAALPHQGVKVATRKKLPTRRKTR
ncbi:MAG: hypothetical protein M0Z50_14070 [Planctomycetia bacterium]|nr:hypothetical protein [Planctomycetia bacterium]